MNVKNNEKNLSEIYDYIEIEQLKDFVKLLAPRQQDAIYAKYGENLDKCILWDKDISKINCSNLKLAKSTLEIIIEIFTKPLRDTLKTNVEIILEVLEKLKETEINIIKKINGENLDSIIPINNINLQEKIEYLEAYRALKRRITKYNKNKIENDFEKIVLDEKHNYQKTCNHFKYYPSRSVIKIIKTLDKNSKIILDKFEKGIIKENDSSLTFKVFVSIRKRLEKEVIGSKSFDFYDNFSESKEEVDNILKSLKPYEIDLIEKAMSNPKLNEHDRISYFALIKKVKNIMYNKTIEIQETIYMLLNEKDEEKVNNVIMLMSDYDRHILDLRYGKDYENPVRSPEWTDEHSEYFHETLIPKLKKELEYLDKPKPVATIKKSFNFSAVSSTNLYGINSQKKSVPVRKIIQKEPVKKTTLKRTEEIKKNAPIFEKKEIRKPINRKNKIIPKKSKSLREIHSNIDLEQLKELVSLLTEKQQEAVYKRYGENLDSYIILNENEKHIVNSNLGAAKTNLNSIIGMFEKTLIEIFNSNIETIQEALLLLDEKNRKIIIKARGENLDKVVEFAALNIEEKKAYLEAIRAIRSIINSLNRGRKYNRLFTYDKVEENIYMLLNEKNHEKVNKIVNMLSDYERHILDLRYGKDYENPVRSSEWNDEHSKYFHDILLPKLRKEMEFFDKPKPTATMKKTYNFTGQQTNFSTTYQPKKTTTLNRSKNLYELYPNIKAFDLIQIVKKLPKNFQKAIYVVHSNSLTQRANIKLSEIKYKADYEKVLIKLDIISKEYNKSFFDMYSYDKIEVFKKYKCLKTEYKIVIHKVHGEKLDKTLPLFMLNDDDKLLYLEAIKCCGKLNKNEKEIPVNMFKTVSGKKNVECKALKDEYQDIDIKQLKEIVNLLSEKQKEAIILRYTEELDKYVVWDSKLNSSHSQSLANARRKIKDYVEMLTILPSEYLNENNETIINAFSYLEDSSISVIKKLNGENLEKQNSMSLLTLEEKREYLCAIKKLIKIINKIKNGKLKSVKIVNSSKNTLLEEFPNVNADQLKELVKLLTEKQEEALYLKYGNNLDEYIKWDVKTKDLKGALVRYAKKRIEMLIYEFTNLPKDKLKENNEIILNVFDYLEDEYKLVVQKLNGINLDEQKEMSLLTLEEKSMYLTAMKILEKKLAKYKSGKLKLKRKRKELVKVEIKTRNTISLKEHYSDIDIEQLKQIVGLLSEKQQETIYAKYGQNLDEYIKWNIELNSSKGGILQLAKKKIADNIICLTKLPSEVLNENNEIILEAFDYLDQMYKDVMKKINGEKLDKQGLLSTLSFEEKKMYIIASKKLEIILGKYKNNELSPIKINKSLIEENPDIKPEQLKQIVNLLGKKQQEAIYAKYGENLDEYIRWDKNLKIEYGCNLFIAKNNIKDIIEKLTNIPSNTLKVNNEIVLKVFKYLDEEYRNILQKVNGEKLDQKNSIEILLPEEKKQYLLALKKLKTKIKKYNNGQLTNNKENNKKNNESINKFVKEYPDVDIDQLKQIVCLLERRKQEAIYARYGKNLDTYIKWPKELNEKYGYSLMKAKLKIKEIIEIFTNLPCDLLNENNDVILKAYDYLEEEHKKVLQKLNGQKLDEHHLMSDLLLEEKIVYLDALKMLENNVKKYKKEKLKPKRIVKEKIKSSNEKKKHISLKEEYSDINIEHLKQLVMLLAKGQQEAIYFRYGQNLDEFISWDKDKSAKYGNALTLAKRKIAENVLKLSEKPHDLLKENDETLLIVLEYLKGDYKKVLKKLNGDKLNDQKSLEILSFEEKKLYLLAIKSFQVNIQKYKSGELKNKEIKTKTKIEINQSLKEKYKNVEFRILLFVVELLPIESKKIVYAVFGENLNFINIETIKDKKEIKLIKKALKKIDEMINVYYEIQSRNIENSKDNINSQIRIKKKKAEKIKMQQNRQDEKKQLEKNRSILELEKIRKIKYQMFEIYSNEYNGMLTVEELEKIINTAVDSYDVDQGISIEIASKFKIETEIIKLLSEKYRKNINSNESLNILIFIIEKFGREMKIKYKYLTDEQIENVIEETFKNYVVDKQFKILVELNLKKMNRR